MSIRSVLLPALAASVLAATPVLAQATGSAPPAAAPSAAPGAAHRDNVVEHRIAELHRKLKITAPEEKPFSAFAQAMRDNARGMDEAISQKRVNAATATAVEQMAAYSALAQAHAEEVSHLVGPFTTLYDALSPEQKKLADRSFREFSSRPQVLRVARG